MSIQLALPMQTPIVNKKLREHPLGPAPNEDSQLLAVFFSNNKNFACSNMSFVITQSGGPKGHKTPESNASNAKMHAIILMEELLTYSYVFCKSQDVGAFPHQDCSTS